MNPEMVRQAKAFYAARGVKPTDHHRAYDLWANWMVAKDLYPETAEAACAQVMDWIADHVNESELFDCIAELLYDRTPEVEEKAAGLLAKRK